MLRVGLTGNIASGKTTVARVWERLGAPVIYADALARKAVEPGTEGLRRVAASFGTSVLHEDGTLDRAALRELVFRDEAARLRLEEILHPEIARLREIEEARLAADGEAIVVFEIPLLFEAGLQDEVDLIVLVDAAEEARVSRIVATRGIDLDEARRIAGAQVPAAEKRARADLVIENAGSLAELETEAAEAWRRLQQRVDRSA